MSMYKSWWKSIYTKIMIKPNYKNTRNKWQEDYANWFIKPIKKNIFLRNFKGVYEKQFQINYFNLFIYKIKFQFIFN